MMMQKIDPQQPRYFACLLNWVDAHTPGITQFDYEAEVALECGLAAGRPVDFDRLSISIGYECG